MIMKPLISIIIPVYNAEKTLERCIDSALAQSFRDYEIILVDDGSKDGSDKLCDRYAALDSRICVIHQVNSGVSVARNVGIEHACGTYVLFLDSDDALEPEALHRYSEVSGAGRQDVVIGCLAVIENGIRTRKIGVDHSLCAGSEIWEQICREPEIFGYAGGKMFRTSLIRSHQITFNTKMCSQEDLDFCLSVYEHCIRFSAIPEMVYQYYYVPAIRTPPIRDFIANQLKMLRIGKLRAQLSEEAQHCVHKRILSLLYTGLYHAADGDDYDATIEKLVCVDGLKELLERIPVKGEHGFVARNFAAGNYRRIRWYFRIRNRIRDIVRIIRRYET